MGFFVSEFAPFLKVQAQAAQAQTAHGDGQASDDGARKGGLRPVDLSLVRACGKAFMSEDQRGPHVTRDGVLARSRNGAVLERRLTQRQRPRQAAKLDARLAALGLEWRSARARLSVNLFESRNSLESVNWDISLAPGVPLPCAPNPRTLLAPDWTFGATGGARLMRGCTRALP